MKTSRRMFGAVCAESDNMLLQLELGQTVCDESCLRLSRPHCRVRVSLYYALLIERLYFNISK